MKKLLSFMISASMLTASSVPVFSAGTGSGNVPSDWAEEYIAKAASIVITDSLKTPWTESIDREQFCEITYDMIMTVSAPFSDEEPQDPFDDVDNEKVTVLYTLGIIDGKSETKFAPDEYLTREEAATILDRIGTYLNLAHHEVYFMFDDESEISEWAMNSVQTVCNLGVMKGVGDNKFDPQGAYTAEQAVTTLVRLYELIPDIPEEPDSIGIEQAPLFADNMNALMPSDKNYMFSPLSIKMALMMAANGADGETQQEILDTINAADIDVYNEELKQLIENYSQSDLLKMNISNSIWINSDNTTQNFSEAYKDKTAEIFGATAGTVTSDTAADTINGWVNEKTNGKIPTILSENDTDFWALLINAVYFKGRWQSEFNESATMPDTFTDRNGKETETDFMNMTRWLNYAETNGVQIVELPYLTRESVFDDDGAYVEDNILDGVDASMYLMMSDSEFNPENILKASELKSTFTALSVPKFKIEYSADLKDMLNQLGILKAFDETAEFENMFNSGNMWITDVIHKTYIDVDEKGTEAAAVTSVGMAGSAAPPEPIEIKFNKPFTFVIKDNISGEILFMGEYAFTE